MQHHIDEFSVTDIRHTLGEVWRVVSDRRWYFILPFCIVSTLALAASLWVPRQYASDTIIKREHDPVFASLGKSWRQPYEQIRNRMAEDITDKVTIGHILDELNLPEGLQRFEDGELSPAARAAREALVAQVAAGLSIDSIESSRTRDVMAIRLTLPEPDPIPDILGRIRDKYVATARKKTVDILVNVKDFFQAESRRCRSEIAELNKRLVQYELKYPGIDPNRPDPTQTEESALVVERIEIERSVDDLNMEKTHLEDQLASLCDAESPEPGEDAAAFIGEPHPDYTALQGQIEKIRGEITAAKTLRSMTEQHPVVQRLRARLSAKQAELDRVPPTRLAEMPLRGRQADLGARKVENQLAGLSSKLGAARTRLAKIGRQETLLARRRAGIAEVRQDYLKLREKSGQLQAELNAWQQNIGPIEHVLVAEGRDRTIHFATVRDVAPITKPSSPVAMFVILVCFAVAAASGVVAVLIAELLDHSYRTVKQITTSLGIPVIESIDEIMVQRARRRQMLRSFVVLPAATFAMVAAVLLAGAMAYLSLESPSGYEMLKASPHRAFAALFG